MAITFQNSTSSGSSSASFDVGSGSNRILFVSVSNFNQSGQPSVTYNGVSMTFITEANIAGDVYSSIFYLVNPTAGSNTVAITNGGSWAASCYNGAKQTSQPDASTSATRLSQSGVQGLTLSSIADNCWFVFSGYYNAGSTYTNCTRRELIAGGYWLADTNASKTPAGSQTLSTTYSATNNFAGVLVSFAPHVDSGPANLKTYNTNLKANIKTIDTNPIANVKSLNTNV